MIKRTIFVIFIILFVNQLFSKPYGLRETNKPFEFNITGQFNYTVINHEPFLQLVAIPEFTFGTIDFGFGFYIPLELNRDYQVRTIEYDGSLALMGKLYYLQYGKKDKSVIYIKASAIEDFTLGHGFIVQRYSNDLANQEIRKTGTHFQLNIDGFHFDGIIGDIANQSVTGGRLAFRPGEMIGSKSTFLKSLEIGFTAVTDLSPKNREVVVVDSSITHRIRMRTGDSDSLFIYGADLSFTLIESSIINFGLYGEFAKINLAGEGIGYGIHGTFFPDSLGLNFKFQFRHLMNSFTPSYIDAYYDAYRSSKINTINNQSAQYGWYVEISRYFLDKQVGVTIAYDEVFKGDFNPHLYISFHTYDLPKRVHFTFRYDRFGFEKWNHLFNVENLDSIFLFELLYGLTKNMEVGFTYRKGFILEESSSESLTKLVNISVFTTVKF